MRLSKEEKALILEALLFSSSVRVCGSSDPAYQTRMIELAKKINSNQKDPLELLNIHYMEDLFEEDEPWADNIGKEFNIRVEKYDE